VAYDWR